MTEEWRPVLGFEGDYEVSRDGRARRVSNAKNTHAGRPLKALPVRGYLRFVFCRDREKTQASAHRAVWEAFNGRIPPGLQVNHLNGDKHDNRLENLAVVTQSENVAWNFRVLGVKPNINPSKGAKNGRAKLAETDIPRIWALRAEGRSQQAIADLLGVSQTSVSRVLLRQTWKENQAKSMTYQASAGAATQAVNTP